ncbi:DJ-1/PfpI family protein [Paenibacillus sp. GP183]|jgi:protease I|uniref:DJ-1/PfpI family protein n=1 Tax=Paenibacillus sp. GP183 TaxID=1882751 RepID=UPI00089CC1BA|nr:DJ-1/PfpI family protein [Paenibacillus sp. GP183]SEB97296.1 protease I [Paenibacillus sp. GP183]
MAEQPKKVAFLLANDFIDAEMSNTYDAITKNGNEAVIISLGKRENLTGTNGMKFTSHLSVDEAVADDYDAVIIPGGKSPSHLIDNEKILNLVRKMDKAGSTIAAISHGPELLIKGRLVEARSLTAHSDLTSDIEKAGGRFVDKSVVVDKNLITSRSTEDVPFFIEAIINKLGVSAY